MSYVSIYIHLVWSTKYREKIITNELKPLLIEHIKSNAKEKGIFIDRINCVADHIHLIVSLTANQSISKIVQLIKGESSYWVNKNKLINRKFEWQDDYFAISISKSVLEKVRKYVENQEEHHRVKSFAEEFEQFIKNYDFENLG